MAGIKRFNFNNYELVDSELKATHIIIPFINNGKESPPIYLRSKRATPVVKMTVDDGVAWTPTLKIDTNGHPSDYIKLVMWWFDNATDDYRDSIEHIYKDMPSFEDSRNRAKKWLMTEAAFRTNPTGKFNNRKSDVGKFMINWLNRDYQKIKRYGRG